jgi:hypothetical protein
MRKFERLHGLLVAGILGATAVATAAQATPSAVPPADKTAGTPTPDAVKRNELLKPGLEQLRNGDATAALTAFRPALEAYPNDVLVLSFCAEAAMESHQDAAALDFFNRGLQQKPRDPWHMRVAMLLLDARLGHWPEFYRDQATLKKAKQDGEKELASTAGFLVDDFEVGGRPVKVAYFPTLAGQYKALYRFVLPAPPTVKVPDATADGDRCKDPNFHPYIDVESDDVDQGTFQARHPDLAAKGGRSYSLDSYPAACSQALIKFYPDGEPTYQTIHADVLKFLEAKPGTKDKEPAKP